MYRRLLMLWWGFLASTHPALETFPQGTGALRFQFREPAPRAYRLETPPAGAARRAAQVEWLAATHEGTTNTVQFGNRIVLQLDTTRELNSLVAGRPLTLARRVAGDTVIFQAPDASIAVQQAHELARQPGVLACYPIMRRPATLQQPYARRPNDTYYEKQVYLEHRAADGSPAGVDLNARAAWPLTRGEGVMVAVADSGVELDHPELAQRTTGAPHWNFDGQNSDARPLAATGEIGAHGTAVAGLIAAEGNNAQGMIGVAPGSRLASWRIFRTDGFTVSDEQLMDMFQFQSNVVAVQNHSWGPNGPTPAGPTPLEQIGISNAATFGRNGKGMVFVFAAGNARGSSGNANDDAYISDPRVIAVGAVRPDGRVASYSEPGACVLVAAPSGDAGAGFDGLFTTDLLGAERGVNRAHYFPPEEALSDYRFNSHGFSGTSAAAPLVTGVAALALSINPNLAVRDVQQVIVHASRHFDFADPDVRTNGAGFVFSHNVGFGVPDAGWAVATAAAWSNRPPRTSVCFTNNTPAAIPDAGLRVLVTGDNIPAALASIVAAPSDGVTTDEPTPTLPLVNVGNADIPVAENLAGKGAVSRRSPDLFVTKATNAANAGAAFLIVYNNDVGTAGCAGGQTLCPMGGLDFAPIPTVFIGRDAGEMLTNVIATNATARAQVRLFATNITFHVPDTLSLEHVAVRLTTDHPARGDLRVTLTSPQGTRSVMQHFNTDPGPGPNGWNYYSVQHFYESSAGAWTVSVSDLITGSQGNVQEVILTLFGVPITDIDGDGLHDDWEQAHFSSLAQGPRDDPDGDGYSNVREQILGTPPNQTGAPFKMDLSPWNSDIVRLSWPGVTNRNYEVLAGTDAGQPLTSLTNIAGRFPETEFFISRTNLNQRFFRVRASAP